MLFNYFQTPPIYPTSALFVEILRERKTRRVKLYVAPPITMNASFHTLHMASLKNDHVTSKLMKDNKQSTPPIISTHFLFLTSNISLFKFLNSFLYIIFWMRYMRKIDSTIIYHQIDRYQKPRVL